MTDEILATSSGLDANFTCNSCNRESNLTDVLLIVDRESQFETDKQKESVAVDETDKLELTSKKFSHLGCFILYIIVKKNSEEIQ